MRYFARVLVPVDREIALDAQRVAEFFVGVRRLAAPKGPLVLQTRVCVEDRYGRGETYSVGDEAIPRALAEADGDLGQKLLATPGSPLAELLSLREEARAIVSLSFRTREVSLSDPHEGVTSPATRLPYGTICRKPVEVGVFRDPDTRDTFEIHGAGSGRTWLSVAVFDAGAPLPRVRGALEGMAQKLFGAYSEGTHWLP